MFQRAFVNVSFQFRIYFPLERKLHMAVRVSGLTNKAYFHHRIAGKVHICNKRVGHDTEIMGVNGNISQRDDLKNESYLLMPDEMQE